MSFHDSSKLEDIRSVTSKSSCVDSILQVIPSLSRDYTIYFPSGAGEYIVYSLRGGIGPIFCKATEDPRKVSSHE